jgi:hypothetical protein
MRLRRSGKNRLEQKLAGVGTIAPHALKLRHTYNNAQCATGRHHPGAMFFHALGHAPNGLIVAKQMGRAIRNISEK